MSGWPRGRAKLLPVKTATKALLAVKLAILAGALGLEFFAHLSPSMTTLIGIVLGAFGLTAAAHEFGGAKLDPVAIMGAISQALGQIPGFGAVPLQTPASPPAVPSGAAATAAAAASTALLAMALLACSPSTTTPAAAANTVAAQADVGAYGAELDACIADNDTRAAIDACRVKARARFCDPSSQMAPGCTPTTTAAPAAKTGATP